MKFHLLNSLNPFLIALTANLNLNDTQNNIKSYFKILNSCLVIVFTYAHQSSSVVNRTARTFRTELICCPPWYEIFFILLRVSAEIYLITNTLNILLFPFIICPVSTRIN
uniref:Uncharacterized protein n=1 Tax=Cacopsylla melanoneura TaxID=428564 RepID=A0A8D8YM64_9HEMI